MSRALFHKNVEIENSPNFNNVEVSKIWYAGIQYLIYNVRCNMLVDTTQLTLT